MTKQNAIDTIKANGFNVIGASASIVLITRNTESAELNTDELILLARNIYDKPFVDKLMWLNDTEGNGVVFPQPNIII